MYPIILVKFNIWVQIYTVTILESGAPFCGRHDNDTMRCGARWASDSIAIARNPTSVPLRKEFSGVCMCGEVNRGSRHEILKLGICVHLLLSLLMFAFSCVFDFLSEVTGYGLAGNRKSYTYWLANAFVFFVRDSLVNTPKICTSTSQFLRCSIYAHRWVRRTAYPVRRRFKLIPPASL